MHIYLFFSVYGNNNIITLDFLLTQVSNLQYLNNAIYRIMFYLVELLFDYTVARHEIFD